MSKYVTLAVAALLVFGLVACSKPAPKPQPKAQTELKPQPVAPQESIAPKPQPTQEPPLKTFKGTPYMNVSVKGLGTIKIRLDPKAAPHNVSNVYQLASSGFYDGLIFHRIIPGFVVQGGDPTGTGGGGPRYTVPAEIKLKNVRGAVAMARQGDQVNPTKASSSCQFYIILKDRPDLDRGGYTVIGNVVEGMDLVDNIAKVQTGPGDRPMTPVVMDKVTVSEQ